MKLEDQIQLMKITRIQMEQNFMVTVDELRTQVEELQ